MRNKWRHVCVDHSSNFERDLLLPLLGDRYNQVIEYAAKAILAAVLPALVVEFRATAMEAQQ